MLSRVSNHPPRDSDMTQARHRSVASRPRSLPRCSPAARLAQTPPPAPAPHRRRPSPTTRSPATSASSANTCSAASRRPTTSRRVQGGFDLGHKSGFYAGTWASNISWLSDGNSGAYTARASSGTSTAATSTTLPRRLRLRPRRPLLLLPGHVPDRGFINAEHDRSSTPRSPGSGCSAKYSYSVNN